MEHPISELMQTAMSSMKDMVDVNTVVGHPVQASSGSTIIPISRVTFGYMTAGGDLLADKPAKDAPVIRGTPLGVARLISGGEVIAEVPLVADADVPRDDFPAHWRRIWENWLMVENAPVTNGV